MAAARRSDESCDSQDTVKKYSIFSGTNEKNVSSQALRSDLHEQQEPVEGKQGADEAQRAGQDQDLPVDREDRD